MENFSKRLKELRIHNNLTQLQLAHHLNVTKSMISAYETGIRCPSYEVLILISKTFNVTTDYLLGIEKQPKADLSGLTEQETEAIIHLIEVMKKKPPKI